MTTTPEDFDPAAAPAAVRKVFATFKSARVFDMRSVRITPYTVDVEFVDRRDPHGRARTYRTSFPPPTDEARKLGNVPETLEEWAVYGVFMPLLEAVDTGELDRELGVIAAATSQYPLHDACPVDRPAVRESRAPRLTWRTWAPYALGVAVAVVAQTIFPSDWPLAVLVGTAIAAGTYLLVSVGRRKARPKD